MSIFFHEILYNLYKCCLLYTSKARTGMGFSKYLLGLRMKKAEELLESGDMNINEVALMVGYTLSLIHI